MWIQEQPRDKASIAIRVLSFQAVEPQGIRNEKENSASCIMMVMVKSVRYSLSVCDRSFQVPRDSAELGICSGVSRNPPTGRCGIHAQTIDCRLNHQACSSTSYRNV